MNRTSAIINIKKPKYQQLQEFRYKKILNKKTNMKYENWIQHLPLKHIGQGSPVYEL